MTPTARAVAGLGFTQIVGWGTTYLMPSVLGRRLQESLGLTPELVFAGITVMFAVSAACSPRIGKIVDRAGARRLMTSGSVIYALSLVGLAAAQGPVSYLACWALMGIASALALSTPSSIAIVQIAGPRSRQAIALLTIIGGMASTVFWPVTGVLEAAIGWRETLLLYAAIHLVACVPIHWLILPRRPPTHPVATGTASATSAVAPEDLRHIYLLLAVSLSFGAFVFTGVQLQMIEMLRELGHAPAAALLLASLIGPSQVGIRLFELLFGHRYSIMKSAVFGSLMLPVGLGLGLLAGHVFVVAMFMVATYGMSNGLKAVQRATLPLALFGRAQFGAYMGRLALPQGIVAAVSPPVMAAVLSRFGTAGALWLSFAFATVSLAAMVLLARRSRAVR
ncbi:MAG: MFS transporter [Reyranella sp.]|uniref:MFS transporter n=1 Tax=Reyranella sp. TaxID=1929291 RepID=UPI001AD54344|nr:MFS transporter [Reyranella sp.]MBN9089989.1 MFS transporter [Reyranella sp.]